MKKNNLIKTLITTVITLLPIIAGIILYDKIPSEMKVKFGYNFGMLNKMPKNFFLFGFPIVMALAQMFIGTMLNIQNKNKKLPKVLYIIEWIIPIITVFTYYLIVLYSLDNSTNVIQPICILLGLFLCIFGNYLPKMDYETGKNYFHPIPKDENSYRKTTKTIGYILIGIGMILIITMFII